ncbi:hypothetical protein OKW21_004710 [Catalinimonas alkaloidigena]|uniref:hypothetical protein n=1 Tax=Catalinimonas alkaloidigena TaxID=1075417 RepID=UPI002405AF79|nr:hypothetical protein [Catalinimonas alkaloidigena]MDF9799447.1 hypothetical protein [Catalinimonas alkaloidigena]
MSTLVGVKIGFIILTLLCLIGIDRIFFGSPLHHEQKKKYRLRYRLGIGVWLVALSVMSLSGFLSDYSALPPRMFIVLIVPLLVLILLLRSKSFNNYIKEIPAHKIIFLQVFRVPVEYFLWLLFTANITPVQMTFEGRNWDIVTGLLAPIVAYAIYKKPKLSRPLAFSFNLLGLLLLINIVTIAILSLPTPFRQFMNEPANVAVSWFPIVFLPGILVPMAYYLHAISFKQLMARDKDS